MTKNRRSAKALSCNNVFRIQRAPSAESRTLPCAFAALREVALVLLPAPLQLVGVVVHELAERARPTPCSRVILFPSATTFSAAVN